MAKRLMLYAAAAAAGAAIWFGSTALITKADSGYGQPGTADDPLITKSYLDQHLADQIKQEVQKQLGNPSAGGSNSNTPPTASGSTGIAVVQLQAGQTLQAGAGSELIVRTGKVLAFSSDENGIPDVTSGKDITAGSAIELNHLLIFPREGRGIKPDPKSKATVFVMVRGKYSIVNADGTQATP